MDVWCPYRNTIRILLADTLGLSLAFLEGMVVFEHEAHVERRRRRMSKRGCDKLISCLEQPVDG